MSRVEWHRIRRHMLRMANKSLVATIKTFDHLVREVRKGNCKRANDYYDEMARDWDRVNTLEELALRLNKSDFAQELESKEHEIQQYLNEAYTKMEDAGCTTYSAVTEKELRE